MYFMICSFSLGFILISQSDKGICAIFLANKSDILFKEFKSLYPQAQYIETSDKICAEVVNFIENPKNKFSLSLDIQGTDFQKNVWKILQNIPVGSTLSYKDVACKLGYPQAYRAVAGACAANKLAVVIPCHRVIKNDRTLSGYRWGIEIKKKLLEIECAGIF